MRSNLLDKTKMVQGKRGYKGFNGRLIELVKAHPAIWNRNDPNYRGLRNRKENNLSETWEKIARECGDGMTADMCNLKWGNIRSNYSRYLRNMAVGNPGKFYLSEEMEFLKPHMDVKKTEEFVADAEETDSNQDGADEIEQENYESGAGGPVTLRRCTHMVVDSRNTDAVFLLSLLPEMGRMNSFQKRLFKQGALELSQLILD